MESSSTKKRRAWIYSSRQWPTVEDTDGTPFSLPSASIADDDVFSDGGFTGKIENWLLGCGSDIYSENVRQLSFESVLQATSFSDDLSLGADASIINDRDVTPCLSRHPSFKKQFSRFSSSTPRQGLCPPSLNLGHSMASSCLSTSTWKTVSSVSEVLQLCSEDAEETLYELGFGCEEPQVTVRIPPRFFTFPSQAQGINFRLFLDSQIRRIREEDPSLSLASRFRQVQMLTAMANAFYSLYSHVSRTPLQKLETPQFTFSSPMERIERFRPSVRSEPRSPVERLKDTVNKMCLYTGSPRGSDSTSPQPSPRKRSSLPEVVDKVLKTNIESLKKLYLREHDRCNSFEDFRLITDGGNPEETQDTVEDMDIHQKENNICHAAMLDRKQTDNTDTGENCVGETNRGSNHFVRTSLASSLSGETVIETDHLFPKCQQGSNLNQNNTRTAEINPVTKVTYDLICPKIIEHVHQMPFCCQNTQTANSKLHISSVEETIDRTCVASHKLCTQTLVPEPDEDSHADDAASSGKASQVGAPGSLPVLQPSGSYAQYCITVTGWEGEDVSLCSTNSTGSRRTSPLAPAQTRDESCDMVARQYLNPLPQPDQNKFSSNRQQVNSFELEEVHSAEEEDFGQTETTRSATSPLFNKYPYRGEVVRGDSVQSDSSGYADEEVTPSSERHNR